MFYILVRIFEHMEFVVGAASTVRVGCYMYSLLSHFISHLVKKGMLCLHDGNDNEPGPGTYSS